MQRAFAVYIIASLFFVFGCVMSSGKALETHQEGIQSSFEDDYVVPKKPIDQHYIGNPWSKQFGPIDDPDAGEIRIRKERSLNNMQQNFALNLGLKAGGININESTLGAGIQAGKQELSQLEGVEIITPVSLADIPFKPKVAYVTEALRLANFKIKDEASASAGATYLPTPFTGEASLSAASGGATEGTGLVVAYKLHTIDLDNYTRLDTGSHSLELGKPLDLSSAGLVAKARLELINPGTGKSLPRNLLWACPRAESMSRDIVAAWIVDIKPTTVGKKSLSIAFPAYPQIEDCNYYSGVLSARIDPVTDRIIRQIADVVIIDAEVSDSLHPLSWMAKLSVVDEQFKIKLVKPSEL